MRVVTSSRNHLFDFLRILFATLVLLSHAFELTDGNRSRELFSRLTGSGMSFGEVGVDGFFLLSGFLIVQSWQRDPELLNFLRKRVLRIAPGYLVAALLSTLVVGMAAPGIPHFFRHLGRPFLESLALLSYPLTPSVFPNTHVVLVNGALWTISYEFRCYLLVALSGICGLLLRPRLWVGLTVFLFFAMAIPRFGASVTPFLPRHEQLFGRPAVDCRLTAIFFLGGCYYFWRDRIRFRPWIAALAALVLLATDLLRPSSIEVAVVLCGSYFLFYAGRIPHASLQWMRNVPDISYGVYLYGWPVLGLFIWYLHYAPWLLFLLSTLVCFLLGWASWHIVERPALTLKRRATAALPPA